VYVDVEPDLERRPLDVFRVMNCSSFGADFSFLVPPGEYSLEAYSADPEARIKGGLKLAVDGSRAEVDLGLLALKPEKFFVESRIREWQAKGGRGNYKAHVGRAPPPWFIADARGAGKNVQLADYRGKWVVLEFWNLSCVPCLKRNLPEWAKFYENRRAQRDRFEILSICVDVDENLDSIAELEKRLRPVVKYVWGREMPFPTLLDARLKTWNSLGLDSDAQTLLVDPQGNLTRSWATKKSSSDWLGNSASRISGYHGRAIRPSAKASRNWRLLWSKSARASISALASQCTDSTSAGFGTSAAGSSTAASHHANSTCQRVVLRQMRRSGRTTTPSS
jgi:hypothetical protein